MLMTLAFVDSDEEKFQKMLNMINKNIHDQGQTKVLYFRCQSNPPSNDICADTEGVRRGGSSVRGVGWGLEILNFLNLIKNYPKHALDSPHPLPPPAKLRHPSSWNNFLDPHMMLHVTVPVDLALLINHILVHFFISVLVLCT